MSFAFILLNIIQAISEFLPISSSGHLLIIEDLYGISESGLEAFLHLPTTIAIVIVFWKVFISILKDTKKWPILVAAIIPAGFAGLFLDDYIQAIFYSSFIIGFNLILWGAIMITTSFIHTESFVSIKKWEDMPLRSAIGIGFAQVFALIPGTSRSGITTLAGIAYKIEPSESARFSFISGFPLILAASLLGFVKLIIAGDSIISTIPLVSVFFGIILSLGLGIVFIRLFTSKHTLTVMRYSGIYRIILGIFVLIWL